MNKKIFKLLSCLIILVVLLIPTEKVLAAVIKSIKPNNYDKYYNYTYKTTGLDKLGKSNYTRHLRAEIYYAHNSDKSTRQVYCLEQNSLLGDGYEKAGIEDIDAYLSGTNAVRTGTSDEAKRKDAARITMALRVLAAAYYVPRQSSESSFTTLAKKVDPAKVLAAQELVWEIIRGERNTLDTAAPKSGCIGKGTCNFYACITGVKKIGSNDNPCYNNGKGEKDLQPILTEYKRLIVAAKYTFVYPPNGFDVLSRAMTVNMNYKSGKYTYTLTDSNGAYKYFDIPSTKNGISMKVSSDGKTLTLTSDKHLDGKTQIDISNKVPIDEDKVYFYTHSTKQDMITGQAKTTYYLNLSTPSYQIKIQKTSGVDASPLAGATFNISGAGDNTCSKAIATVTTDANGIATYNKIPYPGTYYIKETKAPVGYDLDPTPKAVTVSSSNTAGSTSYGTKTLTNGGKSFDLEKYTVDENGNRVKLSDGCSTGTYTGPEFEIKNTRGEKVCFKEIKPGEYQPTTDCSAGTTKLKTCDGAFKVYTLSDCDYTITEVTAPYGLNLPANPSRNVNVCGSDKKVTFTNGFSGLEFQKKDEDGNFVSGGKFALQKKIDNVYKDVLLKENGDGNYKYDGSLTEESEGATYILLTKDGISYITNLDAGEYRVVEKEAPNGYEKIEDKDSKALVTIKSSEKNDYYFVEMVDQKIKEKGSDSSAELVVTITTGRKVPNYVLIISALGVLLIGIIILRNKTRK